MPTVSTRLRPSTRVYSYVATGATVVAMCVTPLVATGIWLLLIDPALATDVATSRDLMPLAWAIVDTLGRALRELLAYL